MSQDIINGLFELLGAGFVWKNAAVLYHDKATQGVYWPMSAFFCAWGFWNLYYYPSLDQWFSLFAGIFLVFGNLAWVGLAIYYRYGKTE